MKSPFRLLAELWRRARFGRPLSRATRWLVGTGALAALVMGALVYWSATLPPDPEELEQDLASLSRVYQEGGLAEFARRKLELKRSVDRAIRHSSSARARVLAMSVAAYLFPDVLPEGNFERPLGLSEWAPLAAEIERDPGTLHSRLTFERLRAMIWNYENPNRAAPDLSGPAKEVIAIYDALSASPGTRRE